VVYDELLLEDVVVRLKASLFLDPVWARPETTGLAAAFGAADAVEFVGTAVAAAAAG